MIKSIQESYRKCIEQELEAVKYEGCTTDLNTAQIYDKLVNDNMINKIFKTINKDIKTAVRSAVNAKANYGENYYYITEDKQIYSFIEEGIDVDNELYNCGNYFLKHSDAKKNINSKFTLMPKSNQF